jgi:hypothetical protein
MLWTLGYTNVPMSLNDLIIYRHSPYNLSFFWDFEGFKVKINHFRKNIKIIFLYFRYSLHFFWGYAPRLSLKIAYPAGKRVFMY